MFLLISPTISNCIIKVLLKNLPAFPRVTKIVFLVLIMQLLSAVIENDRSIIFQGKTLTQLNKVRDVIHRCLVFLVCGKNLMLSRNQYSIRKLHN